MRGREDGNGYIASDPTHHTPCHTELNQTPNEPLSSRLIEKQRVFSAIRQFTNTPRFKKNSQSIQNSFIIIIIIIIIYIYMCVFDLPLH